MDYTLHLNVTQDIGHGITIIFICCGIIIASVLLDLNTGVNAARANKEKIRSFALRRTITKIIDYLRVLLFGVMIDVLGLSFPWYAIPYCAVLVAFGVLLIEVKSVFENYQKSKSASAELPDMLKKIVECATPEKAEEIIRIIKSSNYKDHGAR